MVTAIIMMYVLTGAAIALIVLSSCLEELNGKDYITKTWVVTRWILGWPIKLFKAFHYGVLIYDSI